MVIPRLAVKIPSKNNYECWWDDHIYIYIYIHTRMIYIYIYPIYHSEKIPTDPRSISCHKNGTILAIRTGGFKDTWTSPSLHSLRAAALRFSLLGRSMNRRFLLSKEVWEGSILPYLVPAIALKLLEKNGPGV